MKKVLMIGSTFVVVLLLIVGISWISAFNGEVSRNNDVVEYRGNVYAALSARYEKVGAFIDAIEGANATVTGYLTIISEARQAFANAIASGNIAAANEAISDIDGTFVTLLSYMEDNPESYNTVNLYSGFLGEFSASTNVVTTQIGEYNKKVNTYNTHIQRFPNNLFVGNKEKYESYNLENYNSPLPTFN
ncbi:MAG: LemA family protein [Bacilli bacterium]